MKSELQELVKATLIIGAKRGREDFPTTEEVEPKVEQHIEGLTQRFKDQEQKTLMKFLLWYKAKQAVNTFDECGNKYIIEEFYKSR